MRRIAASSVLVLLLTTVPASGQAGDTASLNRTIGPAAQPASSRNFTMVGHNPLFGRGMNAAPAVFKNFLYVGNRTDGSAGHRRPGVLVVDISKPSSPDVVGEIDQPFEGLPSQTSRELRVWPRKRLLMVMNFACSTLIHSCVPGDDVWDISFYDLSGDNARHPRLISRYVPSGKPHEMFLWEDPERPHRALLYISTPHSSESPEDATPNLIVTDISRARTGIFKEIATFTANPRYRPEALETRDVALHSMGVSADGTRTYLAYLGGGFLVLDSSELAGADQEPKLRLLTPVRNSPAWRNQTVHSAVKVPGQDLILTTDEIYGDLLDDFAFEDHGCPWGWVHLIDISDPAHPRTVSEYKIDENTVAYCESEAGQDPANTYFTSVAAHNPTVLPDLAFVTWHSGGLQAFSVAKARAPSPVGHFSPKPLPGVVTEDVALSQGLNKVVMWSYPIIKDGLLYLVDVRNGLYVLRYEGPGSQEVAGIRFLEGNSNLGDAERLEGPSRHP